jgi:hypothetical protein
MGGGYPRDLATDSTAYTELVNVHANVYRRAAAAIQQQEYAAARGRQQLREQGWKFGTVSGASSSSSSAGTRHGSGGGMGTNNSVHVGSVAVELEQSLANRHRAREAGHTREAYRLHGHIKGKGV